MVVISKSVLNIFCNNHSDAYNAVLEWYNVTKEADWKDFHQMKKSFNSVDAVGNDRYVFNIKGNKYRLVALIIFKVRTVFILFIGNHNEYDAIDASKIDFKKQ